MIALPDSSDLPAPFPAASGRGVRVAVIDSGVNTSHSHIAAPVTRVMIGEAEEGSSPEDTLGHGTAVTAAIQEKAPAAEYFAVKVFGPSLRTSTSRLFEAIEWAIAHRMDVINLSLGTRKIDSRGQFQALVEHACSVGSVLVSARDTGVPPLLPGTLPQVIGVDVDWDIPRHRYRIANAGASCCFFASGYPRPLPGVPPARNLNGISFAVANMSGFVACACERLQERSFDSIRKALEAEIRAHTAAGAGCARLSEQTG